MKPIQVYADDGNGLLKNPKLSGDGKFVVYSTRYPVTASDDDKIGNGNKADVFVYNIQNGTTELVSLDINGIQLTGDCVQPAISSDGRYVVFSVEYANDSKTNAVYARDRVTHVTKVIHEWASSPDISSDGKFVTFKSGSNIFETGLGQFFEESGLH